MFLQPPAHRLDPGGSVRGKLLRGIAGQRGSSHARVPQHPTGEPSGEGTSTGFGIRCHRSLLVPHLESTQAAMARNDLCGFQAHTDTLTEWLTPVWRVPHSAARRCLASGVRPHAPAAVADMVRTYALNNAQRPSPGTPETASDLRFFICSGGRI